MNDANVRIEVLHSPTLAPAEIDALVEIEKLCYPPRTRYSRRTIRRFLEWEGSVLTRACGEDSLAGFQIGNLISGQLITLDVPPRFRRQGIGSAILLATLDEMRRRGLPFAQCEIAVDNKPSIRLHEQFGFQAIGRIPGYYEDGTDALLMILVFPEAPRGAAR